MSEQPQEHWTTERMVLEGHADYATREDLEGVADEILLEIAELCPLDADPDVCIPCYAFAEYMERQQKRLEAMAPKEADDFTEGEVKEDASSDESEAMDFTPPTAPWDQPETSAPVVDLFAAKVEELSALVREMLDGPPIPPKDVSFEELALLVVAADRWIKMTEAQGVELSPNQQKVLDSTKDLVARLRS